MKISRKWHSGLAKCKWLRGVISVADGIIGSLGWGVMGMGMGMTPLRWGGLQAALSGWLGFPAGSYLWSSGPLGDLLRAGDYWARARAENFTSAKLPVLVVLQ
jgi:hypothetical protein